MTLINTGKPTSSHPSGNKPLMPRYRLHQASGQAVATLDGSDVYRGPSGSIEARRKYNQVVAEFTITGKVPRRQTVETPETTVKDVIAPYLVARRKLLRQERENRRPNCVSCRC